MDEPEGLKYPLVEHWALLYLLKHYYLSYELAKLVCAEERNKVVSSLFMASSVISLFQVFPTAMKS